MVLLIYSFSISIFNRVESQIYSLAYVTNSYLRQQVILSPSYLQPPQLSLWILLQNKLSGNDGKKL